MWGAAGPASFDCSGLTMMAWAQAGVALAHYTGDQLHEGTAVDGFGAISPGDLVLIPGSEGTLANPGHVGLYIGDGLVLSATDPATRRDRPDLGQLHCRRPFGHPALRLSRYFA